jgi:hypothetical protein
MEQTTQETEQSQKYETVKSEEYKYGNNFLEIARKKVDNTEFISVSKGFYNKMGQKRYKQGIGFPDEKEIKDFLIKNLQNL